VKGGKGMPTYDYRCLNCKKTFSIVLSIKDHEDKKAKCPKCKGKKLQQLVTTFQAKTSRKS
jgi:putative FmdB family regulatory protein